MALFELDYSMLDNFDKKIYKYEDVKDKLVKVCFDIFRFKDKSPEDLWEVVQADDGEYFVAKYSVDNESLPTKKASTNKYTWEVIVKEGSSEVNLFYRGVAFVKFAHDDADTIKNFLPQKLSTDKQFVSALISSLTPEKQKEIKTLYPELF